MKICKKRLILGCMICLFLALVTKPVEAASTKTVTGTCKYDAAYDVLRIVNQKRASSGLGKLTMDKDLLAAAMKRAVEISVVFDHTRPNGERCFTACNKMYGENVAYGFTSSSDVMQAWMGSSGHKANIMNGGYQSIGVGCIEINGVLYWVQCFGYCEADKATKPNDVKRTYKVSLTGGVDTKIVSPVDSRVSGFAATPGKNRLTLKWKKKSGVDGYQLQISTTKTFKVKGSYTIGKNATKKVVKKYKGAKLKSKKKYYVRIRAFVKSTDSQGNVTKKYSKWKTISKVVK